MSTIPLPSRTAMIRAFRDRDAGYDGVFLTAVRTTGIFCRPVCPARRPRVENVDFYASVGEALEAGYRPCKRCRPLEAGGAPPGWLRPLLDRIEEDPARRWRDVDLRGLDLHPDRVRRWFQANHGMTFHAYSRARRMGAALDRIRRGEPVTGTAFDAGYESLSGFHEAFRKIVGDSPTRTAARNTIHISRIPTPLGVMIAGATERGLCLLEFEDRHRMETQLRTLGTRLNAVYLPGSNAHTKAAARELEAYFAGRTRRFTVPLELPGTDFQQAVWRTLRRIPHGRTASYAEIAERIGRPGAVRAVARPNAGNRVAIVVPCHRVIGSDGKLAGYAGGLWRKQRLLDLERGAD